MARKSSAVAASRTSANTPATSSISAPANKSSILRSAFAPTSLQLHLFASVIQSFDSQQLRIHDTTTGRLRQQHATNTGTTITSLDWGHYGPGYRESRASGRKKRKRGQSASEDVVVGYGTSSSEICMFSPAEGRILGNLTGGHENGIEDFKFTPHDNLEGWSLGSDGKLVQWNLTTDRAVRTITLSDPSTRVLTAPSEHEPTLLVASTAPYSISLSHADEIKITAFDAYKQQVHSLVRSGKPSKETSELFIAADADRFMNVFDFQRKRIIKTLVTASAVEHVSIYSLPKEDDNTTHDQLLAAVTQDGTVELFVRPFAQQTVINRDLKSQRRAMTRKSDAQIRLIQPSSKSAARVLAAAVHGSDVIVVSVDGGVEPSFQKVRWQDEGTGELLFQGTREVVKTKGLSALNAATTNGVKDMGRSHVDDSRTVVVNGSSEANAQNGTIEISSDEGEGDGEDDEDDVDDEDDIDNVHGTDMASQKVEQRADAIDDEDDSEEEVSNALVKAQNASEDEEMQDADEVEPSFGDLLAAKHPGTIDIANTAQSKQLSIGEGSGRALPLPSGMSLGTVLTQALRTNDNNLLESCLHANDTGIIQNTIQRLSSGLAAILLSKLAERLASRPGRYGHLLSWVQWTCIAHGGAIAAQPDVTAKIKTLYRVLNQRTKSLDKLLLLKGKLDMLEAQMNFRKQLYAQRSQKGDESEPGMIYIEGETENWSSDEGDHDEAVGVSKKLGFKTRRPLGKDLAGLVGSTRDADSEGEDEEEEEEEDDEEMPTTNGVGALEDSDDEIDSESDVAPATKLNGVMVDIKADVSGEDDLSGDEEGEGDDLDGSDDDEEDDEEDSEMDSFINDGSISEASEDDDIVDDDDEDTPKRPSTKRSKHR